MDKFPKNPFQILDPHIRWAPSKEDLDKKAYEQLIPPLVYKIRIAVKQWRDSNYAGASETTKALIYTCQFISNFGIGLVGKLKGAP